ncbi:MAG: site-specific integrase [Alphaproteobacteria bacterium]|nr:site-specific integrase [Alphaproteobacteria bacterium]
MASIRKRGNKYHVQVRRKGFAPATRSFHKLADAQEWARHMETKADRGDMPTPVKFLEGYKVKDVLERYRDEITIKKLSAHSETCLLNAFMRQPIANLTLAQITPAHFSAYRDKRLKDVKPGTVNRELSIIKHAFDIAEREWDIPIRQNLLAKVKKLKVNNARSRRLTDDEYEALLEAIEATRNDFIKPLINFAIETGMRRGEILRLCWSDIDYDSRTLHIPITKNGHARTIPLTSNAIEILKALQFEDDADTYRPFPLSDNAAKLAWQRLLKRSGVEDLHFHDFRHEAISRFFERGLSVPEVALISGHRDFRMLFRYTHLKPEDIAKKLN